MLFFLIKKKKKLKVAPLSLPKKFHNPKFSLSLPKIKTSHPSCLGFSLPKPVKFSFSLGKAIATETQPHLPRPSLNHPPALTKTKEPLPFFPSHLLAKPRDPALQW